MSAKRTKEEIAKYQERLKAGQASDATALAALAFAPEYSDPYELLAELLAENHSDAPVFPRVKTGANSSHRQKVPEFDFPFSALVARPVGKKEIASEPTAQAALDAEWTKLVKARVWDANAPREWSALSAEARKENRTIHVGRVFEICVEKGSELPAGSPGRKYKGRSVFQGNAARDQNFDHAIFQELGSNPASLTASKLTDFYG